MTLPKPHGGTLVQAYQPNYDTTNLTNEIQIDTIALSDLELIGVGLFSPLTGFLNKLDYESVVQNLRLATGTIWSVPVTLPVTKDVAKTLQQGET